MTSIPHFESKAALFEQIREYPKKAYRNLHLIFQKIKEDIQVIESQKLQEPSKGLSERVLVLNDSSEEILDVLSSIKKEYVSQCDSCVSLRDIEMAKNQVKELETLEEVERKALEEYLDCNMSFNLRALTDLNSSVELSQAIERTTLLVDALEMHSNHPNYENMVEGLSNDVEYLLTCLDKKTLDAKNSVEKSDSWRVLGSYADILKGTTDRISEGLSPKRSYVDLPVSDLLISIDARYQKIRNEMSDWDLGENLSDQSVTF